MGGIRKGKYILLGLIILIILPIDPLDALIMVPLINFLGISTYILLVILVLLYLYVELPGKTLGAKISSGKRILKSFLKIR